jgi:hypothetical protein
MAAIDDTGRGEGHGWSNRSDSPCLIVGTMIDAIASD